VQAKRANAEELNNYPYFENDLIDHDTNSDADFDMNLSESEISKAHQQLETSSSAGVHCTNSNTNVADDSKIAPTERQMKVRTMYNYCIELLVCYNLIHRPFSTFVACSNITYSHLFCYYFLF